MCAYKVVINANEYTNQHSCVQSASPQYMTICTAHRSIPLNVYVLLLLSKFGRHIVGVHY